MNQVIDRPSVRLGRESRLSIAQPYSNQAEQAVIGALLIDPQEVFLSLSDKLSAEHFYDPFCKAIYGKAMEICSQGLTADAVLLSARLDGLTPLEPDEIQDRLESILQSFPTTSNLEAWADLIIEKAVERNLANMGEKIKGLAHAQEMSAADKLAEANRLLVSASTSMGGDDMMSTEDMVASALAAIEKYSQAEGGVSGLSTGFDHYDQKTTGMHGGELIILAARPAMGKTAFAMSIAKAVSKNQRKGVAFFSLEMGAEQVGMRWLSAAYDIDVAHMRSGRVSPAEWQQLNDALVDSADIPFYLEKNPTLTIEQITAKVRRLYREKGLSLVIIDYLQLISDAGRSNSSRAERVGEISRALKILARELDIPVIALSQLNRTLEQRQDKRPIMSDLRESGSIEQDADVIGFLYRDEVYNANTQDAGIAELILAKQRNGPTGTIRLGFEGSRARFTTIAQNGEY